MATTVRRNSRFLIYALGDPRTGEIRYVGKSSDGVHRPKARHAGRCWSWMIHLKRSGLRPTIYVLQRFANGAHLNEAERFWISEFRCRGCPLTNLSEGGDSGSRGYKHTDRAKQLIAARSAGTSNPMYGKGGTLSPVWGRKHTGDEIARIRASNLGKKRSEETRRRVGLAKRGTRHTLETRSRMRIAQQRRRFQEKSHGSD